jgi:hypothetical protein
MREREPDLGEDPRKAGTGDGGYPEENPAAGGGERGSGDEPSPPAPDTSSPEEGDSGQATGNPHSAG